MSASFNRQDNPITPDEQIQLRAQVIETLQKFGLDYEEFILIAFKSDKKTITESFYITKTSRPVTYIITVLQAVASDLMRLVKRLKLVPQSSRN